MKLLMENWRSFINEQDEEAVVDQILDISSYEDYVAKLGNAVTDDRVKAVLAAGLKDGNPQDESVGVSPGGGPCTQFMPIQNEIDLAKSLGWPATKDPKLVPKILQGGPISGDDLGGSPIISAMNYYIVDGHHRWSQIYMINPRAVIETMDIKIQDPEVALRAMQAAIAVVQGRVPSAQVEPGMNIFQMPEEEMVQWMQQNFSEEFVKLFIANSDAQDVEGVIKQILSNISLMRENNPPQTDTTRGYMPQTGNEETINQELGALKRGIVNFKEPAE